MLVNMEQRCYVNEYCPRNKCLEISGIFASVKNCHLESKVLDILEEIEAPVNTSLVDDYFGLHFQSS